MCDATHRAVRRESLAILCYEIVTQFIIEMFVKELNNCEVLMRGEHCLSALCDLFAARHSLKQAKALLPLKIYVCSCMRRG